MTDGITHRELIAVNGQFAISSSENLLAIDSHLFIPQYPHKVLAIAIFNGFSFKDECVFNINKQILSSSVGEIEIGIRLLLFLGKVIDYIENGKAEVCLARSVRTIDYAVLDNAILYSKCIERIVAMSGQIYFYPISEPSEISYGKLCKHIVFCSLFQLQI